MKSRLLLLAVALCVVSVGVAFAEPLMTTDFQGDVSRIVSGDTVQERRIGRWQDGLEGVFQGNAQLTGIGSRYTLSRGGELSVDLFRGTVDVNEEKDASGVVRRSEVKRGRFVLPDGGYFTGYEITISCGHIAYNLNKMGDLVTPFFKGSLTYSEARGDGSTTVTTHEKKQGREIIGDAGVFEGVVVTDMVQNLAGENLPINYNIARDGILNSSTFRGRIQYTENKTASGSVNSKETMTGREVAGTGGYFEGIKTTLMAGNRYTVSKQGKLVTSEFQGTLSYSETGGNGSVLSSREVKNGTWLVTPSIKLVGEMIVESAGGQTRVIDNRRQVAAIRVL